MTGKPQDYSSIYPRAGVAVWVCKDGKWLLGKRKGAHGSGEYASPGGHLEYMESFADCARRETREESGIEIKNIRFLYVADLTIYAPRHYMHVTLIADWKSGEPTVIEPDKLEGWDWYDIDHLPGPHFVTTKLVYISLKTGQNYFDADDPAFSTAS